jgi:outer membrane lipoprotein-sorting protein
VNARRPRSSALLLAAAAALAAGCAIALPPPREAVPEEARRALARLAERWQGFTDLRALADVELARGGERQRLSGVVLARAPGSVRFEALSPFGQPFLFATVHEGRLAAYDAATHEAVVGPATADTTARLLHLPFDPEDVVAVLAGHAVPPRDLRVAAILPPDGRGPSLSLTGAVHEQRIWMDVETGVVHALQIIGGRTQALVVYRRDAGGALTGVDVDAGDGRLTGTVRYRSLVVNGGVEAERFQFVVPKGAKTHEIR